MLFISHNLAVIAKMCDRVGVMYAGELVEQGPAREVFERPAAPVHGGAAAVHPAPAASARTTGGWTRSPASCPPPARCLTGCIFTQRCAIAQERCERRRRRCTR